MEKDIGLENAKLQVEINKLVTETRKLASEERKNNVYTFAYPAFVAGSLIVAGVAIGRFVLP